jgi:hypothetical protein
VPLHLARQLVLVLAVDAAGVDQQEATASRVPLSRFTSVDLPTLG